MSGKKPDLDEATIRIMRRVLNTPPKHHDEMKVGRPVKQKKERLRAAPAPIQPSSVTCEVARWPMNVRSDTATGLTFA